MTFLFYFNVQRLNRSTFADAVITALVVICNERGSESFHAELREALKITFLLFSVT